MLPCSILCGKISKLMMPKILSPQVVRWMTLQSLSHKWRQWWSQMMMMMRLNYKIIQLWYVDNAVSPWVSFFCVIFAGWWRRRESEWARQCCCCCIRWTKWRLTRSERAIWSSSSAVLFLFLFNFFCWRCIVLRRKQLKQNTPVCTHAYALLSDWV